MTDKVFKRIKLIAILISTLCLLFITASVSWFYINKTASINSGDVQLTVNNGDLKIALVSGTELNYSASISLIEPSNYMVDLTGNGEKLYYPKILNSEDEPADYLVTSFEEATDGTNDDKTLYMEYKVSFQATTEMDVYLSDSSYVSPYETNLIGSGVNVFARKSLLGDFSCDGIAGAVRVAFLTDDDGDDNYTLKCIWIPNDDYYLYYVDDGNANLSITTEQTEYESVARGYSYYYASSTEMASYTFIEEDYATGTVMVDDNCLASSSSSNNGTPILSFTEKNSLATKTVLIRIWVEGTDREADKAFNGGKIKFNLSFVGLNKDDNKTLVLLNSASQMSTDTEIGLLVTDSMSATLVYCNASDSTIHQFASGELIYSLDGINWISYDGNSDLRISDSSQLIFVRLSETSKYKPSNILKVTIPIKN